MKIITYAGLLLVITFLGYGCKGSSEIGLFKNNSTIQIASYPEECHGVVPQLCLLTKAKGSNSWGYFYDTIEGFEWEPGYEYKIRVTEKKIENPPLDASSKQLILKKIISKELMTKPSNIKGKWEILLKNEHDVWLNTGINITFDNKEISFKVCNMCRGNYSVEKNTIQISDIFSTKMYCNHMDTEHEILSKLKSIKYYEIHDNQLSLWSDKHILIKCIRKIN